MTRSGRSDTDPLGELRHRYAEALRVAAGVEWSAVVRAFAAVPRERFVGPGVGAA